MSKTYVPVNYKAALDLYNTQKAISLIKRVFEDSLRIRWRNGNVWRCIPTALRRVTVCTPI